MRKLRVEDKRKLRRRTSQLAAGFPHRRRSAVQQWLAMWLEHLTRLWGAHLALVHGLGLLHAVHAVLKVRSPQGAIGWALALVSFPWWFKAAVRVARLLSPVQ